jgi:hypothetical protein
VKKEELGPTKVEELCKLTLVGDIAAVGIDEVCRWIGNLEHNFDMKVECVYKSRPGSTSPVTRRMFVHFQVQYASNIRH